MLTLYQSIFLEARSCASFFQLLGDAGQRVSERPEPIGGARTTENWLPIYHNKWYVYVSSKISSQK